jgi:predicted DNA-binding transcriptional regulator YafY
MSSPSETPSAKRRTRAKRPATPPDGTPPSRTGPGRRAGAYTQTERVLELLARLQARRTPAQLAPLAAELGISVKQLRRDLAVLHAAGHGVALAPVEGRAAVRLLRGRSEAITLTLRERFALLAMRDVLATLEGTPLAEDAASIFRKIAASLPDDAARDLRTLGPSFRYLPDGGLKRYEAHADALDALLTGALHRHAVRARYRHSGGAVDAGRLEPWGVALYRNGLYVVGRWDTESAPRVFAVERFAAATRLRDARFEVPADFSIASFFDGAFGVFAGGAPRAITLDFDPAVRAILDARRYHPSQRIRRVAGGRIRMTLELATSPEVVSWLVGWGPMVRVVSPADLAESVAAEHRAALAGYASTTKRGSRKKGGESVSESGS